jgi:hypothetical protein
MEIAAARPRPARFARDFSFLAKVVLAAAFVALADLLFFPDGGGSTIGLFALALTAGLTLVTRGLRHSRAGLAATAGALIFAVTLGWDPSLLAVAAFWTCASLAALLPRAGGFDDAWRWALRLAAHSAWTPIGPFADFARLHRARRHVGSTGIVARLPLIAVPLLGSALFLALFAAANPLIENAFARVDLALILGSLSLGRISFWLAMLLPVWALLRPRQLRLRPRAAAGPDEIDLPGFSPASVLLSLFAFNAVFALENGLDLAFLWSGAPLPAGMTLAGYAHRGAYPLIVTALLAGLFVLVTLRPGSALAESVTIRRLVYLWIGQNVLLVASTILRTLDYVDAYSLTRLRIAALVWMALVAVGLILLCWRILRGRSGAWLINANAAAAALALAGCTIVDLGAIAAQWNVRHAREVGGRGSLIDLCYLHDLGPSALLPLIELESRPLARPMHERVAWVRNLVMDRLEPAQRDWREWRWRDAGRLAAARERMRALGLPRTTAGRRLCDGTVPQPLTPSVER